MRKILRISQTTEAWDGLSQEDKDGFMHGAGDIVQELSTTGGWVAGEEMG